MILVTGTGRSGLHLTPMRVFEEHDIQIIRDYVQMLVSAHESTVVYNVTAHSAPQKLRVEDFL